MKYTDYKDYLIVWQDGREARTDLDCLSNTKNIKL